MLVAGCAAWGPPWELSGKFTSVYADVDGVPMAKAGLIAAALWILGTGTRLAFQLYATHGGGVASTASARPTTSPVRAPGRPRSS